MEKPPSADKALKILALVCIIALTCVTLACIETKRNSQTRPVQEIITVRNQAVTLNNQNYNISYSIKAQQSTIIDKILVKSSNATDPSVNTEVNGATVYINGTAVNIANPLDYRIDSGNNLQVNVIIPCTKAFSNETSISVFSLNPYSCNYVKTMLP
jgi:hypothetical protein